MNNLEETYGIMIHGKYFREKERTIAVGEEFIKKLDAERTKTIDDAPLLGPEVGNTTREIGEKILGFDPTQPIPQPTAAIDTTLPEPQVIESQVELQRDFPEAPAEEMPVDRTPEEAVSTIDIPSYEPVGENIAGTVSEQIKRQPLDTVSIVDDEGVTLTDPLSLDMLTNDSYATEPTEINESIFGVNGKQDATEQVIEEPSSQDTISDGIIPLQVTTNVQPIQETAAIESEISNVEAYKKPDISELMNKAINLSKELQKVLEDLNQTMEMDEQALNDTLKNAQDKIVSLSEYAEQQGMQTQQEIAQQLAM